MPEKIIAIVRTDDDDAAQVVLLTNEDRAGIIGGGLEALGFLSDQLYIAETPHKLWHWLAELDEVCAIVRDPGADPAAVAEFVRETGLVPA
jgi:hypothetical protein